jgi:hypothetical protein
MMKTGADVPRCTIKSASSHHRLEAYGAELVRQFCANDWPVPDSPTPKLDALVLGALCDGGLKTRFTQHLADRVISVRCAPEDVDRLAFELQLLLRRPVTLKDGRLVMDAHEGLLLLESCTGAPPELAYDTTGVSVPTGS